MLQVRCYGRAGPSFSHKLPAVVPIAGLEVLSPVVVTDSPLSPVADSTRLLSPLAVSLSFSPVAESVSACGTLGTEVGTLQPQRLSPVAESSDPSTEAKSSSPGVEHTPSPQKLALPMPSISKLSGDIVKLYDMALSVHYPTLVDSLERLQRSFYTQVEASPDPVEGSKVKVKSI